MAQFTIYRSTDASAPTVSGTAGSVTGLLDACLCDGYGSQSAAGWTKAFTATNRRAYRNGSGSTQLYWRVRDDAGGTGGAKEALIRGFEAMTDVNTGTNPFPTSAQSSLTDNSWVIRKSTTADATARSWIVVADAKTCYVFIASGDQANTYYACALGDFYSVVSGDAWNACLVARSVENSSTVSISGAGNGDLDFVVGWGTSQNGNVVARSYTGTGGALGAIKVATWNQNVLGNTGGTASLGFLPYPNAADSSIYLSRVFIGSASSPVHLRGYHRGLWGWCHSGGVNDGDTFNGSGDLAGKTFLIIKNSPNQGLFVIETSNTLP
jgi:hypothetical protein